jgi:hypothetical protein
MSRKSVEEYLIKKLKKSKYYKNWKNFLVILL